LAADIYASRAHFVLELLQNADDNEYAAGTISSGISWYFGLVLAMFGNCSESSNPFGLGVV
jgi:hypothetical protein